MLDMALYGSIIIATRKYYQIRSTEGIKLLRKTIIQNKLQLK